jgi:hypothetical protein
MDIFVMVFNAWLPFSAVKLEKARFGVAFAIHAPAKYEVFNSFAVGHITTD